MNYTDSLDFATLEREAYIRGDMTVAQLAAVAQDRSEEVAGLEENVSDLETEVSKLKEQGSEDLDSLRQVVTDISDRLYDMVKDAKRVSDREQILALIVELCKAGKA